MNRLQRVLAKTRRDLDELDMRWCLVGGLAVAVWGEPRLTRDVDVVVAVSSDTEAESVIRRMQDRGWRLETIVEQEAVGRLATARFGVGGEPNGIVLDLLFASSGVESEAIEAAVEVEIFEGLEVPVSPRSHLIVMKLLARDDRKRPMDADDLKTLIASAGTEDLEHARELAELVESRGYARGRRLRDLLEKAMRKDAAE